MKKVLIIEDDKNILELEKDYLEIEGFEVDFSMNGEDGLLKALAKDYDLIVLDLMLPGLSGYEVCSQLRKKKDTPILMVTAKVTTNDKVRGLGLGADDYLVKPFDPAELVARVKAHIKRYQKLTQASSIDIFEFKDLKINYSSRQVYFKENEIALTAKEYDLLTFLTKHKDIAFEKSEIFDKVWGYDSLGDASAIVVHLTHIRDKMPGFDYITTVRGVGYRFSTKV